jgi:hypothetical protein
MNTWVLVFALLSGTPNATIGDTVVMPQHSLLVLEGPYDNQAHCNAHRHEAPPRWCLIGCVNIDQIRWPLTNLAHIYPAAICELAMRR